MSFPGYFLDVGRQESSKSDAGAGLEQCAAEVLTVDYTGYTEGTSETGFTRTWHPAQPHTMRDGLAHKSMPVGNVHLILMQHKKDMITECFQG